MPGPRNYDDIVRRTVPEPDSGFRPSREEVERAQRRTLVGDEAELYERVTTALAGVRGVQIEVTGDRVTLTGTVSDAATAQRVEAIVAGVEGVDGVDNQLIVGGK